MSITSPAYFYHI